MRLVPVVFFAFVTGIICWNIPTYLSEAASWCFIGGIVWGGIIAATMTD